MDAVIIRLVDLPVSVHAVTRKDAEGDYNVYINARLDADTRALALRHELKHIVLGHFYDDRPVVEKEQEASDGEAEEVAIRKVAPDLVYR